MVSPICHGGSFGQGDSRGRCFTWFGHGPRTVDGFVGTLRITSAAGKAIRAAPFVPRVNFTGQQLLATTVDGLVPGPVLCWREGDRVTLNVTNHLAEQSSIHWHGIILPTEMDGVPCVSFNGIDPGETFRYTFDVRQSGTCWCHSHSDFQEQTGMYGAIIIDPPQAEQFVYDRDYVIMLSDWSNEEPDSIYAKLKKLSHNYNFAERPDGDFICEIGGKRGSDLG